MKKLTLSLLSVMVLTGFLFSCGSNESSSEEPSLSAASDLTFEIVDSLAIDYLGTLAFCDITPDGSKVLLYDRQRGAFLVTNKAGETLHSFTKSGETPDFPGMLSSNPVFFGNDQILGSGRNSLYFYDLDGNLVNKVTEEAPSSGMFIMMVGGPKSIFSEVLDGKRMVIQSSSANSRFGPAVDEFYTEKRAVKLVDVETSKSVDLVPLHPESRFLDGKGHVNMAMNAVFFPKGTSLYVAYSQDPTIYKYEYRNGDYEFVSKMDTQPELFYFEDGKDRKEFENQGMFPTMGAGAFRAIYANGNKLITSYNAGVKPEERSKPEISNSGGNMSVRISSPPTLPKNKYQYFEDGKKIGADFEAPAELNALVGGEGDFLWFTKDVSKATEESDYIIYYKVKVAAKK